jgi:tRNA (guanine-N7-)-methyltransferase
MRKPAKLPLEALAPFLAAPPDPPAPIDWSTLFGNDHPVELEVGFGKGLFLFHESLAHPDVNFVGVEIVRKYQLLTATRMVKANQARPNVRLYCTDARAFLHDCVAADSLAVLHVYFPDPWWKTRHHKRRLFTAEFAAAAFRALRPSGRLSFATDVPAYFETVQAILATMPAWEHLPPPEPGTPANDMDYLTNFERKFRQQGRAIYRLLLQKPLSATSC